MKLSIILVNQNLHRPLRQAMYALKQAIQSLDAELIVVDNASTDRSVVMLTDEFQDVNVIQNIKPVGFATAVNQGIKASTGDYVLVQSPTVITAEDSLEKLLAFVEAHADTGGLSVRMLDAEGNFIADSKRAMPTQWIRFFGATGLSKLFSKSQLFSHHYHSGWGEEFENTETDVLNNCFMLLRRSVLNEVGLFDERFKAYGQEIDLSYRIRLAGYKNFYFAKTFVIQQSVPPVSKWSWHFIKHFYGAMLIFAAKYLLKMPELKLKAMPRWSAPAYEFKQ
ncbi:glycosyltransferase family 2 protein [Mucilaginibacter sp. PAMB04168]|uniref:glycosyltransferase family 2 protein n=1 Tax=Mucilaginibacter sp. PAMB04168 TaxID=3138567 RepID=UPI0031F601FD